MRTAWIVVVLAACSSKGPPPPVSGSGSAPAALLPPTEAACATDDDCAYAYTYEVHGKCCDGTCTPQPANHAWIDKAAAICKRVGYEEEHCPVKKCAAPPPIACVAGTCRAR